MVLASRHCVPAAICKFLKASLTSCDGYTSWAAAKTRPNWPNFSLWLPGIHLWGGRMLHHWEAANCQCIRRGIHGDDKKTHLQIGDCNLWMKVVHNTGWGWGLWEQPEAIITVLTWYFDRTSFLVMKIVRGQSAAWIQWGDNYVKGCWLYPVW